MTLGCQNVDALPKKGATGGRDIFLKRRIGDRSTGSGVEADGPRSHTDAGDFGPIQVKDGTVIQNRIQAEGCLSRVSIEFKTFSKIISKLIFIIQRCLNARFGKG